MRQFFPLFYENFLIYSDTKIPFGGVWRGFLREIKDYSQMSKKQCSRSSPEQTRKEWYNHLHFSFSFSSHSTAGRDRPYRKEKTNEWGKRGRITFSRSPAPNLRKKRRKDTVCRNLFSSSNINSRTRRTLEIYQKSKSTLIRGI